MGSACEKITAQNQSDDAKYSKQTKQMNQLEYFPCFLIQSKFHRGNLKERCLNEIFVLII